MVEDKEILRRQKISRAMKGRRPNNFGIPRSLHARQKSSETMKKIGGGKWNLGSVVPEERRRRISASMKGKMPANLSFLHSMPYTDERRKAVSIGRTGKRHTEATKLRISEAKRKLTTPLYKAIRECYRYTQWRVDIFKRDAYTCVLCKKVRGTLNADHFPTRFIDIISERNIKTIDEAVLCEELWTLKNGRTLCLDCHRKTDNYGNRNVKKH
jgi:NUMOD3 motif-containing protein